MTVPRRIVLVTGLSGAGKTTALKTFEDEGWETVDNLPLSLLDALLAAPPAEGIEDPDRSLAIGVDTRTRGFDADEMVARMARLRRHRGHGAGDATEILFLDCDTPALIRRFSETRRRHPLAHGGPAEDGIARERLMLRAIRQAADHVIDTGEISTNALQQQVRERFGDPGDAPTLTVLSFGFKHGVPTSADLMFDMRFLQNPHWVPDLRPLTGFDRPVIAHVAADPAYADVVGRIEDLLLALLPRFRVEGKSYVTIAIGCTGGRHRSVHVAERIGARLRDAGFSPTVRHRDVGRRASESPRAPAVGAPGVKGSEG